MYLAKWIDALLLMRGTSSVQAWSLTDGLSFDSASTLQLGRPSHFAWRNSGCVGVWRLSAADSIHWTPLKTDERRKYKSEQLDAHSHTLKVSSHRPCREVMLQMTMMEECSLAVTMCTCMAHFPAIDWRGFDPRDGTSTDASAS
jgi:hypothetical protein